MDMTLAVLLLSPECSANLRWDVGNSVPNTTVPGLIMPGLYLKYRL